MPAASSDAGVLSRGDARVHNWMWGSADRPLVVCTHGASMDHRMFAPQVEPLVDAGYRVLAWDMRGHGLSKPLGQRLTLEDLVDDLLALLDAVGGGRVVLVGQSLGGYVSQALLRQQPQRVRALVVIGSTCLTQVPPRLEHLALRYSTWMFRLWPDRHLRRLIAKRTAVTPPVQRYAYEATRQQSKAEFVTVWRAVAHCLRDEPDHRIGVPFLLSHGDQDRSGTVPRDAPAWAAREPTCRYEVIPRAGHNANQDNPEEFNRILLQFLDRHAPPVRDTETTQ